MNNKTWPHYQLTPTRYKQPVQIDPATRLRLADPCELYYGKQNNVGWRFVINNSGFAQVGPIYKTKAELLADLPRYAESWGFLL